MELSEWQVIGNKADAMEPMDWEVIGSRREYSVEPWFRIDRESLRLPDGRVLNDFYRIGMPDFAMTVAYDASGRQVLVKEYKPGPRSTTLSPPAGLVDGDETPVQAARRELLEETGRVSDDWYCLGSFVVDANRHCGTMHLFLALNARVVQAAVPENGQILPVVLMNDDEVFQSLASGAFSVLPAAAAISIAHAARSRNAPLVPAI